MHFFRMQKTQGFQRLSAVITKRLLEQQRKGFCQNRNALYIRTLHAMQIFLLFTDWQNFIMCRSFRLMCHPDRQTASNVAYVAAQLRALKRFLEQTTGRLIDEDLLAERVARGRETLEEFEKFQSARADRFIPSDLVSPLYSGMTNNILLGTEEEKLYTEKLLKDIKNAPPKKGKHIYWMHTIPFWSDAVKEALLLNDSAQIVGCELSQVADLSVHSEDPYEEMAMRLVYHALNGPISRRIEAGIHHAKQAGADGAVWFNHWGCKHTLGGSRIAKKRFVEAGIPMLILDGDGCDRSHGGEGQTSTRLGAFLEMLGDFDHE